MAKQRVQGTLFVVAAPSGAGKSTLVNRLVASDDNMQLSVSHTTRPPRPNEVDGVHYHFVSHAEFMQLVADDQFFEYANVHGDMKGTSVAGVMPILKQGKDVLLEIDYQGAAQVRKKVPACKSIFILPPSRAELERRLRARGTESETAIQRRLRDSCTETTHAADFDFVVVNDRLEQALQDLQAIVRAVHLETRRQQQQLQSLFADLACGVGSD